MQVLVSEQEVVEQAPKRGRDWRCEQTQDQWNRIPHEKVAVRPIRRLTPRVGRNQQCHCGSGVKFKRCHGRLN